MNELQLLIKNFGTHIGLLLFILYKEIPLWLKKRNGQWVEYTDNTKTINEVKENLEKHIVTDKEVQAKIAADLEIYKVLQTQISIGIQKELTTLTVKMDKIYDLILENGKKL